jgi:ABC-type hemin transport system ATPase subunit
MKSALLDGMKELAINLESKLRITKDYLLKTDLSKFHKEQLFQFLSGIEKDVFILEKAIVDLEEENEVYTPTPFRKERVFPW